jgi:hypothetical protein
MARSKSYTVTDGKLVLELTPDDGDWYCVTAPMHPGVVTQAKTIPEAFEMARDAIKLLSTCRKKRFKQQTSEAAASW